MAKCGKAGTFAGSAPWLYALVTQPHIAPRPPQPPPPACARPPATVVMVSHEGLDGGVCACLFLPIRNSLAPAGGASGCNKRRHTPLAPHPPPTAVRSNAPSLSTCGKHPSCPPPRPQEFCDQGTLRQALDRGRLKNPRSGRTHLPVALALARDVVGATRGPGGCTGVTAVGSGLSSACCFLCQDSFMPRFVLSVSGLICVAAHHLAHTTPAPCCSHVHCCPQATAMQYLHSQQARPLPWCRGTVPTAAAC